MAVVWCIWEMRNKVIFKRDVANVNTIVTSVKYTSWGWFIARGYSGGIWLTWNRLDIQIQLV